VIADYDAARAFAVVKQARGTDRVDRGVFLRLHRGNPGARFCKVGHYLAGHYLVGHYLVRRHNWLSYAQDTISGEEGKSTPIHHLYFSLQDWPTL
jgi:hypothetical protein